MPGRVRKLFVLILFVNVLLCLLFVMLKEVRNESSAVQHNIKVSSCQERVMSFSFLTYKKLRILSQCLWRDIHLRLFLRANYISSQQANAILVLIVDYMPGKLGLIFFRTCPIVPRI